MSIRTLARAHSLRWALVVGMVLLTTVQPALAGTLANLRGNNVGGVKIDEKGVLQQYDVTSRQKQLVLMKEEIKKPAKELAQVSEMRMVSLKGLEATVAAAAANGTPLPDEVRYLAGIQRIQYVFVYPEEGDIVLAGPGEGWKVRDDATVVGVTTDRPVIQLDDLLVALRTAKDAGKASISVSIDPTEEGRKNLDAAIAEARRKRLTFDESIVKMYTKALGPQKISFTGVPEDSHMARVLAAADFRMKRIAMHLEPSPLPKELPSFLTMQQKTKSISDNMMPRWWLACNYEPIAKAEDGLAWELRGPGVKCMTEDEFVENGKVVGTGKVNKVAQAWADAMTKNYDALAKKEPIFGELRNVMDLCIIAALIEKEGLLEKANLKLPTLQGSDSALRHEVWNAPKMVDSQSSFLKVGREFIITVSGGVEVTSWEVANKTEVSASVAKLREANKAPAGKAWWR